MVRIALYQPDIPQNAGAMMRLCACLGVPLDIIEPCGFPWDERKIRQAGMDYIEFADYTRHQSWEAFKGQAKGRIILMTTKAALPYTEFNFQNGDILLAGRESSGVPAEIHEIADARICIPMQAGPRSLNIVNATSMIMGEALRQLNGFSL
jgi:tRNA (cytidine/uridine-2'-O-)-methyltransferase